MSKQLNFSSLEFNLKTNAEDPLQTNVIEAIGWHEPTQRINTKAGKENNEQVPGNQAFRGKTRRFNSEDREGLVGLVQGLQGRALDVKYRKNFRKREQ